MPLIPHTEGEVHEMLAVAQLMSERGRRDGRASCFFGADACDQPIPAAVWQTATHDEFYNVCTLPVRRQDDLRAAKELDLAWRQPFHG